MKVQTDLLPLDILKTRLNMRFCTKSGLVSLAIVSVVFFSTTSPYDAYTRLLAALISTGLALFAYFVVTLLEFLVDSLAAGFRLRLREGVLGKHEFKLTDDGLFERTEANETLTTWSGIRSIKKTANTVYIRTPVGTHTLPRRDFTDRSHFEEFCSALSSGWASGNSVVRP